MCAELNSRSVCSLRRKIAVPIDGLVGAHALEHGQAVVQGVGEHVGGGFAPGHELAVVPDEAVAVGHGHDWFSSFLREKCDFIAPGGAVKSAMERIWKPNVTVAAVIERDGRFLLVEEETDDGIRFNQPAGHLDEGESLVDAAAREALEETAHRFMPEYLVGIYQWRRPDGHHVPALRLRRPAARRRGRAGAGPRHPARPLADAGGNRGGAARHRSPLVMQCVRDYLAGRRFGLDLITHYET
jgi:ADP-ribose pyrophosphatase YjhB (NUDIX family)